MVIEDINVENIEGKLKLTVSLCEKNNEILKLSLPID